MQYVLHKVVGGEVREVILDEQDMLQIAQAYERACAKKDDVKNDASKFADRYGVPQDSKETFVNPALEKYRDNNDENNKSYLNDSLENACNEILAELGNNNNE
ncbi:MAG: hypothetical protein E7509_04845 [Ruminococcus sp.]|nr:hypothetical protein [Ruminococcus sp.]